MSTGTKKKLQRCPNCGHAPLREETVTDRFEYRAEGEEPFMVEAHGVPVEVCPNCGERYFGPAAVRVQHAAVCRALGLLTPEEIQAIRERFGPTQTEFARLTGIGEATISRWERGRMLPNRAMDHYLRLLDGHSGNAALLKTFNSSRSALPDNTAAPAQSPASARNGSGQPETAAGKAPVVPRVPTCFDVEAFAGRWFSWAEISACFWPGRGGRAAAINPHLAPVRDLGGIYLLAWSDQPPAGLHPSASAVRYIGESSNFKQRMGGFGSSAGLWGGGRQFGHLAGWRWPEGQSEHLWVAFFAVGEELLGVEPWQCPHLAAGMRKWLEAAALEEHRRANNGQLPEVNAALGELAEFQ
jgi:HTH-type transcriptional regulator / antitoxin MqsA